MEKTEIDPKGLIRESYRMEGIRPEECRAVFLDWALSLSEGQSAPDVIPALLERYEAANPGHPMNTVLREGLGVVTASGRWGGRAGRIASDD